jgi:hypothetical protein
MRGLPPISSTETFRVRRWDALILGGALPGLIAAIRIAKRGLRVLIVEEAAALEGFQGVREPFLMTGATSDGVLGACLRELGVPLIERRRFTTEEVALQVVLPDARIDVGRIPRTTDELTAWGLAKPESARVLLLALEEAGLAERDALLSSAFVRGGSRPITAPRARSGRQSARGLPRELADAPEAVRRVLSAVLRGLSGLGEALPGAEARARLLGGMLEGGAVIGGGDGWLRGMLRRRIDSLYGECRSISSPIRLVSVAQQPGLAIANSDEIWAGRVLVLNAPRAALASACAQAPPPEILRVPAPTRRRAVIHLSGRRSALAECMSERVICVADPAAHLDGSNVVAIRSLPGGRDRVDLVAWAAVVPGSEDVACEAVEGAVRRLLPFSRPDLLRQPLPRPIWDSDDWLADPRGEATWPDEVEIRVGNRPTIYALDRGTVGGLGFEGELLLGWRAGDAIAAELT